MRKCLSIFGVVCSFAALVLAADAPVYKASFMVDWKNPLVIETMGKLVLPHPSNFNGKMFSGWKGPDGKLHPKYDVVTISSDARFIPEYANLDLTSFTAGSTGVPAPHRTGDGIFYALGDSITFGTKAGGNAGAWPKFVGEVLGLPVVNNARAGSRLSAWRSTLTQARNHNQYIDEHAGGVTRPEMLSNIRAAAVIGFTLGTNDLLYNNTGSDVAYRMTEFVDELHRLNPKAVIVAVGGANSEAFRAGGQYAQQGPNATQLNELLGKILNGPKYRDFAMYVDITDLFSEHGTYEPCERAPDGVHPGFEGQKAIAKKVLSLLSAPTDAGKRRPQLEALPETDKPKGPSVSTLPSREEMWGAAAAPRVRTATREKVSLNGLWSFSPENMPASLERAPKMDAMHYFFKVPGRWPENNKWAKNGMAVYDEFGRDAFGKEVFQLDGAWYARPIDIPASWCGAGRAVKVGFAWVPSAVLVYVDGAKVGEIFFPGGEITLPASVGAGRHELAFYTSAKIPETMITAFDAPDTARSFSKSAITCRGINGDVWIASEPSGVTIADVQCRPDTAAQRLSLSVGFEGKGSEGASVVAVADVYDGAAKVRSFSSRPFVPNAEERIEFGGDFPNAKQWDLDAPQNMYAVRVRLEAAGKAVDELYPETFGFRDIKIDGRNILLNGSVVHFRPRNTRYSVNAAVSNDDVRRAVRAMKAFGYNSLVSEANYGFSEGDLSMMEMFLHEASSQGMAAVVGLPHPNRFDDPKNPHHWQYGPAYDRLVKYIVKRFQNIPGVLYWSSTHNQTGYESDQNPEIISGRADEIPTKIVDWRQRFRGLALKVNEKMAVFDPTRPVYHHESGALGTFYTLNCYLDWVPIQERSDWFEHWQEEGVVPLIIVEWGSPHIASWSSFRGGPQRRNIWSARDWTQQCWMNEFNASFLGERAFADSPMKHMLMDRHEFKIKGNRPAYYGGNFTEPLINEQDTQDVLAMYARRNYKDMRARGVTSFLPWDMDGGTFFTNNPALPTDQRVRENALDGIRDFGAVKSDYYWGLLDQAEELPRTSGQVVKETYTDLLAWVAGPRGSEFTTVNDTYRVGETIAKSLVILNDSRRTRSIDWAYRAGAVKKQGRVDIAPGARVDVPVLVQAAAPGTITIQARFRCEATGWKSGDDFKVTVLPAAPSATTVKEVALFDPDGTTRPLLESIGVRTTAVTTAAPQRGAVLVVGRHALPRVPFDIFAAARAGVRVVVLEQTASALEKIGFRTQEYGLRNLFALDPAWTALDLTDWRGAGTTMAPTIGVDKMVGDFVWRDWQGYRNARAWRAGNRGTVASVLPEKPTRGNFRALTHGGFDLQYAPAMVWEDAGARIVLSQLDLCARADAELVPEAQEALVKLLDEAAKPMAPAATRVCVVEGAQGKAAAECAVLGIPCAAGSVEQAKAGDVVVVGTGAPAAQLAAVKAAVERGVRVIALGLTSDEANAAWPSLGAKAATKQEYPDLNGQLANEPILRGVSNADIQWTYPSNLAGFARFGKDVLTVKHPASGDGVFIASSITPWTFDDKEIALRPNRRRAQALVTRLVANCGAAVDSSFGTPTAKLYADKPLMDDDPYRYYRW